MLSDHFILLVTKQFSGTITSLEETELQHLLKDVSNLKRYETLQKFWNQTAVPPTTDTESALRKVLAIINTEEPPFIPEKASRQWLKRVAIGAALLVVVSVALWIDKPSAINNDQQTAIAKSSNADVIEKQNLKGTRSVITLADGSKVWLNADSKLRYPSSFTGATREIELSGEAFFEVTKNPKKPFIIHLSNGTVRVLGTSFNIKAYPGDNKIETSVSTGRVAFIPKTNDRKKGADTTFLTKNFKAVYLIQTGLVKTVATSGIEDKAWTDGKLIFHSTSMGEIATALERYFGKQVVINDEEILGYHLTGSFENNSAEEILYYLSKTKPFTYQITETQIIIALVR